MVLRLPKLLRLLEKPSSAAKNGNHNNHDNNHSSASDKDEKKNEKEEKKEIAEPRAPPWVARTDLPPVPKKIKFLFVSLEALIGDMAWIIKNEGHEVRYSISDKDCKDICDGFVDKTDDWKKDAAEWADVIVFDDVGFGQEADALRKQGKLVIGGSAYTDKLEDSREFGQDELAAVGVNVLPHWDFDDFDSAVKFIEQNPGRYVMKPSGDAQNEKELLFIAQEEDSKDLLNVLAHYKKAWSKKIKKFQIQKYAAGVEVAVGAFFNGKDFLYPINVNFEHKKLFPGEIGPSTGEMGCYKEGTKVLTREGWKDFRDVSFEDEFATLNPESFDVEYHRPTNIVKYTHHKKMVEINNQTLDLCVTLDHNMVGVESNRFRKGERKLEFVAAKNLPNQFVVLRSSKYVGTRKEFFVLPGVVKYHRGGQGVVGKKENDIAIKMDDWLKFFGLWLAEGYTAQRSYSLGVCQCKPRVKQQIREILSKLPFKFIEKKDTFECHNKSLWSYLRPLGGAIAKFIPEEYLSLSREQLQLLYDNMFLGDGNQSRQTRIYYTSSKKLAENTQEILMKIGRVGIIKERLRKGGGIGNRKFKEVNPSYEVMERVKKTVSWIDKRDTRIVDYDGAVYCVEVPNHILYVKYNEKPLWCGNTLDFWSQSNALFNSTLAKMKDKLAASGYCGYIDINCIANARGIFPLEFTSRFGYPTLSLFAEGVTMPWGEFFYRLARGETPELKTKKGFQICVVIAVPPFPFEDLGTFKKYSEDATILFKKSDSLEGVHLGDVKLVEDDWRVAGVIGYALVITGSGATVEEARKQAYKRVGNVMIPNMFYRTDIGLRWHRDSDRLQTWGYLY